jgi:hypothetical protein
MNCISMRAVCVRMLVCWFIKEKEDKAHFTEWLT